jgi:hypothetical protein
MAAIVAGLAATIEPLPPGARVSLDGGGRGRRRGTLRRYLDAPAVVAGAHD